MNTVHILHVIKGLGRGGAERLLVSTIREHGSDHRFTVVYFLPWKDQLVADLRLAGATVICLPARNVVEMMLRLPALVRLMRMGGIDLIHAHLPWSGILARVAGRVAGIPVVYTEHNLVNRYRLITRWMNRVTFSLQSAVVAVSEKAAEELVRHYRPAVRVEVIPNGVDVSSLTFSAEERLRFRRKFGLSEHDFMIGTVAVFTRQKRIDRFIRICRKLSADEGIGFVLVGDGFLRKELESEASDLLIAGRMKFAGLSDVPEQWLACMDVFLSTSDYEGLPVALLEAMGTGCVPVVTAVGGVPSVVRDGVNGFLYQPEEEEKAVEIIRRLSTDAVSRQELGMEARRTVEREFGIRRMVDALEKVYKKVLV